MCVGFEVAEFRSLHLLVVGKPEVDNHIITKDGKHISKQTHEWNFPPGTFPEDTQIAIEVFVYCY